MHVEAAGHAFAGRDELARSSPLQNTRFVVRSGKLCRRLKRIWHPNFEKVPVPVLSPRFAPVLIMSSTRSRYCTQQHKQSKYKCLSVRCFDWSHLRHSYTHLLLFVCAGCCCWQLRWYMVLCDIAQELVSYALVCLRRCC